MRTLGGVRVRWMRARGSSGCTCCRLVLLELCVCWGGGERRQGGERVEGLGVAEEKSGLVVLVTTGFTTAMTLCL